MNKVSEKIINDALAKVKEIEGKSIEDINKLRALQKAETEKLETKYNQRLSKIYDREYKKIISQVDLTNKGIKLLEKRKILDDMLNLFSEKLKEERELYISFLKAMIVRGVVTGKEEIIIPEGDREIYNDSFFSDVMEKNDMEFPLDFTIKIGDIKQGLILKNDRIEFNGLVDTAVQYIFEEYEIEISDILFNFDREDFCE